MTKPVALIVGGGSGIGADAARVLAEDGFDVGVMSSSGRGEALGTELFRLGFIGSNLIPEDLEKFRGAALDPFGRIDAFINNTGHGPKGDVLELSDADWRLGMDYYLLNVVRMTCLVMPTMLAQGNGSIVSNSTFAAFEPDRDLPTSAVFRAGLASFVKQVRDAHAAMGVWIYNVLPRFIDSLPVKPERIARIPAGRYAQVRELSRVVALLASDAASYITGQSIRVDGGLTRSV